MEVTKEMRDAMEKRIADLEGQAQGQQETSSEMIDRYAALMEETIRSAGQTQESRKEKHMDKIDETITSICDWIQTQLKEDKVYDCEVQEMTKALAELVTARTLYGASARMKMSGYTPVNKWDW